MSLLISCAHTKFTINVYETLIEGFSNAKLNAVAVDLLTSKVIFYPIEYSPGKEFCIAENFEMFLCALVSIRVNPLKKSRDAIKNIKEIIGCKLESNFWELRI